MKLQGKKESIDNLTLRNWSRHHFFPWTKSSHPCPCGLGPLWCRSPLVLMLLSSQGCPERHSESIKGHLNTVTQYIRPEQSLADVWGPLNRKSSGQIPIGQGTVNLWVFPFLTERKLPEMIKDRHSLPSLEVSRQHACGQGGGHRAVSSFFF